MQEQEPFNPYQAPLATEMHPQAAEWLGSPSASLSRVALGLGLVYAGIIVVLVGVMGGAALMFITRDVGPASIAILCMIAAVCIGGLLNIVGSCLCLAAPEETGARGMIFVSVGAMFAALLLGIVRGLGTELPMLNFMQFVFQITAGVSFLLFLGRLNRFIGRHDLAGRARAILVWSCILAPLMFASAIVAALTNSTVVALVILAAAIGWLIVFVSYVNLITATRKAILGGYRTA